MRAFFRDVDGARIRYYHAGEGRPLLLVHGFGSSSDFWQRVFEPLAQRHAVYAPDLLGHGFSDWVDFGTRAPQLHLVDHLLKFVDSMGIDEFDLVGSSLGGILAPLLYRARPRSVRRLMLVGIDVPVSPTGLLDPEILSAAAANGSAALREPSFESCRKRLANICHDPEKAPLDIAMLQVTAYALPDRLTAYLRLAEGMAKLTVEQQEAVRIVPEQIEIPTLMLCGLQDPRASIETLRSGVERLPQGRLVEVDACGHLPHVEHPQLFAERLLDFLRT